MDAPITATRLSDYVAWKVRRRLADYNISAAELARRTGYKQPYLSRRMVGAVAWDVEDLQRIADALSIDVRELLPTSKERDDAPPAVARRDRHGKHETRKPTHKKMRTPINRIHTAARTDNPQSDNRRTARKSPHTYPIAQHAA